ncbi:MAG: SOS response-associated peptidase [Phycisphaerales bacterium]|nr:SOS response-associated peptidase [Phycisphaerales bacterium]
MCGRFTHRFTWSELHRLLSLTSPSVDLPLRFNVAPTQHAPVVRAGPGDAPGHALAMLRWGFAAPGTRAAAARAAPSASVLINARAETVATRPTFREAFRSRRCIVPVSGFYEWTGDSPASRRPMYITPRAAPGEPAVLLLGGLWEHAPGGDGVFCIITTPPNAFMRAMHDRMPLMLNTRDAGCWLDPGSGPDHIAGLLRPGPEGALAAHEVSRRVNSPKADDSTLIQPVESQGDTGTLFG